MLTEVFLARLERVRRCGPGRWMARCPAHADRNPSLSIREGERGLLVKCWAGCAVEEITAALGLTLSDLFYDGGIIPRERRPAPPQPWHFDWRRASSEFLHHAEGLRIRAEAVLDAARGLSTAEWSDSDLEGAMNAVCRVRGNLEWAEVLEDVAFDIRAHAIATEREKRHAA